MSDASPLIEETPMLVDPSARQPGEGWIPLVRKSGTPKFAAAFVVNPDAIDANRNAEHLHNWEKFETLWAPTR